MSRAIFIPLFFFKLIGLATFSIITINQKKTKPYKKKTMFFIYNKLGTCYNIILCCLVIGLTYMALPMIYYQEYFNKTIITTSIEILQGVLGIIVIVVTLFCYCFNQSVLVKVGNHLINILEELRRLQEPVNRKRIVSVLILVYFWELILFVLVATSDYIAYHSKFGYWLVSILPSSFVNWLFIQYYAVLIVMHAIFVNTMKIVENIFVSRTEDVQVNYLHRSRRVFINSVKIQSLTQLRSIHGDLCNISVQLSHFYSYPILLGTILKFLVTLYNSYYLFEPLLAKDIIIEPLIVINILLWLIFLLYPIGLLTTKVTTVINEVEQAGSTVHALLNHTFDREVKSELKLFSLQLLHQKVKFSANGYFVLDNTLFRSILSTVTTYLVILIQFQMGQQQSSCNTDNCTCNDADRED